MCRHDLQRTRPVQPMSATFSRAAPTVAPPAAAPSSNLEALADIMQERITAAVEAAEQQLHKFLGRQALMSSPSLTASHQQPEAARDAQDDESSMISSGPVATRHQQHSFSISADVRVPQQEQTRVALRDCPGHRTWSWLSRMSSNLQQCAG